MYKWAWKNTEIKSCVNVCANLLLICCVFVFLGAILYINVFGFAKFNNSDVYADMQIAQRMWEQKTLFPEGWIFGNQYYVIATPVLAALMYGVFGNINTAMISATEIMTVLILISFVWLLRGFTKDTISILLAVLLLLVSNITPYGPYSVNALLLFQQASFYACYLITAFVVFGDYVRAVKTGKTRIAPLVISLVLCFATGMQSLRQTVIMVLPVLACELFQGARRFLLRKKAWEKENRAGLVHACSYGVANLGGIVFIEWLDIPNASIYGEMNLIEAANLGEKLQAIVNATLEITSLDYVLLGDNSRVLVAMFVFLIMTVLAAALIWLFRIKHQESGLELCWLLCAVGILGVFLSTVVLDITLRSIYAFMWFPLIAFSALLIMEKFPWILKICGVVLICGLSVLSLYSSYGVYIESVGQEKMSDPEALCQWAVANGYEYVYGDYWEVAPGIAVYSDGKLDAGCWHTAENVFMVEMVNTPQDIYGSEENVTAIYVFTPADEEQGLRVAAERGLELVNVANFGKYHAYTSPVQLMRTW